MYQFEATFYVFCILHKGLKISQLVEELRRNPFLLAPMAGITDKAFRSFMRKLNCGIVTTELVSANGLKYSSEKTKKLMQFSSDQHPIGIQIFGERLAELGEAAQIIQDMGADFVDLNFGCPVKKVVSRGAGSAILKDLEQLKKVLRVVKSSCQIPVTIKIRTGWDADSRNAHEVAQIAYDEGIAWVAIHGRTRAQAYNGQADWDFIAEVKNKSPLPIIGNGDITNSELALKRLKESSCDGVMIGRGCLKNPWIFRESLNQWLGREEYEVKRDFSFLFRQMYEELLSFHEDRVASLQLKKFAAWYSSGYPGAAQFRKDIFSNKNSEETISIVNDYFSPLKIAPQADTSHEGFLMGGHG